MAYGRRPMAKADDSKQVQLAIKY